MAFEGTTPNARLAQALAAYVTNSGEPHEDVAVDLMLRAASQTAPLLLALAQQEWPTVVMEMATFEEMAVSRHGYGMLAELGALFTKHGSDKATGHDYHALYAHILGERRQDPICVFEVGLGSNNLDVVSNMGAGARPGASLRAFRDFLPRAHIYGADVDRRILFEEDRIKTYHVDQAQPESVAELARELDGVRFDLIVDDGLHSPDANLAMTIFAMKKLRRCGWLVVEDIREDSLPIWHLAKHLLPTEPRHVSYVVRGKGGYLFVVQKQ